LHNDIEIANFRASAYISCMLWCQHILPQTVLQCFWLYV